VSKRKRKAEVLLQLVRGLPDIDYHSDALCGACQKGKIVKTSFKSKDTVSTSRSLELHHIDLFGPVSTASIYESKYGLVIVDDYSRWSWVKFLKSKYDSYDVFSKFCIQIQSSPETHSSTSLHIRMIKSLATKKVPEEPDHISDQKSLPWDCCP